MSTVETNVQIEQHPSSEAESQVDTAARYENEIEGSWDQELFDLVAANAHVIIKSPWHQGSEMTLRAAILSAPQINEANLHMFVAEVMRALAEAATETEEDKQETSEEESAESEEVDEKINAKIETQQKQVNSNKADADNKPVNENVTAEDLEAATSRLEEDSIAKDSPALTAKSGNALDGSAETLRGSSSGASDGLAARSSESVRSPVSKPATNEVSSGFASGELEAKDQVNEASLTSKSIVETKQSTPTPEIPEAEIATNSQIEVGPIPNLPELVTDEESSSTTLPAPEVTFEPTSLDENSKIAETEDDFVPEIFSYELDTEGTTDFIEGEEVLLAYSEDSDELDGESLEATADNLELEEASIFEVGSEVNPSEQQEIALPEQWNQTSVDVEEVENALMRLAEAINTDEAEEAQKMNEILDKIIEVPAKLEASGGSIITESEAQLELEELFTELLDITDVDYTPELIESLTQLSLKWHLTDDFEKLSKKEEVDELPPISVTHEIINRILIALSTIKKAITHAGAIGKSALQLYHFNFATGQQYPQI